MCITHLIVLSLMCGCGTQKDPSAKINAHIKKMMKVGEVQGMAVAIIKDNKVLFSKGYGYADVSSRQPVTPKTLFFMASSAKPFTAMALGLLVDKQHLEWDKPIKEYIPYFKLYDESAAQQMTPRDILCHRSGLARHDLIWHGMPPAADRKQFVEKIGFLEPQFPFREKFYYQNLMFIAAGHLTEAIAKKPWEILVDDWILKPLSMNRTVIKFQDTKDTIDVALGYKLDKNSSPHLTEQPESGIGSPASGMFSCAEDMIKWVGLHLNRGAANDSQLISEATLGEMHKVQMVIPPSGGEEILTVEGYGLGWIIERYRGHRLIRHGGAAVGFETMEAFMPDENLGIVVLCNTQDTLVPSFLMRNIVDLMLGMEPVDFFKPITRRKKERIEKKENPNNLATPPSPSLLTKYEGLFQHPAYGYIAIRQEDEKLKVVLNNTWKGHLDYIDAERFMLSVLGFKEMRVLFKYDRNGNIFAFTAKLEPDAKPIEFLRSDTQ